MKSQMKAADRSGARFAAIVGEDEAAAGVVTLRDLRPSAQDASMTDVPARSGPRAPTLRSRQRAHDDERSCRSSRTAWRHVSCMRTDWCGELTTADEGREVVLCGWVATRREHGEHLAFVDVRDRTGVIQCVVDRRRTTSAASTWCG